MLRCWSLAALPLVAFAAPAVASVWQVDPGRSSITVEIDQGGKPVPARFESFQAEVAFDPRNLAASKVVVTVDLASFKSGNAQRDQMATAGEFLAAATAATATYRTAGFTAKGGDSYEVAAELSLKGASKKLVHPARITVQGGEARAQGEVVLDRLAFGVGAGQFPRGDQVGLTVVVRFDLVAAGAG
jgi:polyisoprenoid-binding protein YceI